MYLVHTTPYGSMSAIHFSALPRIKQMQAQMPGVSLNNCHVSTWSQPTPSYVWSFPVVAQNCYDSVSHNISSGAGNSRVPFIPLIDQMGKFIMTPDYVSALTEILWAYSTIYAISDTSHCFSLWAANGASITPPILTSFANTDYLEEEIRKWETAKAYDEKISDHWWKLQ